MFASPRNELSAKEEWLDLYPFIFLQKIAHVADDNDTDGLTNLEEFFSVLPTYRDVGHQRLRRYPQGQPRRRHQDDYLDDKGSTPTNPHK